MMRTLTIGMFLLANWLQNSALVHAGLSCVAVTMLLFDAQRRARGRGDEALPLFPALRNDVVASPRASES